MTETAEAAARSLNANKSWLVGQGDELGKSAGQISNWKSQFRILLEAARHENEPDVLINLLRYQAVRNQDWMKGGLSERLEKRMGECVSKAGADVALAMELIRHLLLYTLRSYTYYEHLRKKAQKSSGQHRKAGRP